MAVKSPPRIVTKRWTLQRGDVRKDIPDFVNDKFDGAICDPPYGLGFMGNSWDKSVPSTDVWAELLRVCKPGASLLAFGAPRTIHRLVCNIEDAGWQIRDKVYWLYGSGFPKSHDIGKALEKRNQESGGFKGYGTALKPAAEEVIWAMKPIEGSFAKNVQHHGCGGLNINGSRVGESGGTKRSHQAAYPRNSDGSEDRSNPWRTGHSVEKLNQGRWPTNVILDEESAVQLDDQSPTKPGPSRLFYASKPSHKEKLNNNHPTVKPLALCEYLARLILPPERETPRRLIVPFSGSGSEMLGGLMAGWDQVTGIEMDDHFCDIAKQRLSKFSKDQKMCK